MCFSPPPIWPIFPMGLKGGKITKAYLRKQEYLNSPKFCHTFFCAFYLRWKIKKPVCVINCHDERIRGSCLRDENNKGINYCRHHQGWNDTAMCTPFPWQLAMGRWMFHSHSAPRYTSINQTYIKSTRFLLWAERRAGLFSCYCIIMEKKHKTMRSFWAGNKLRNY